MIHQVISFNNEGFRSWKSQFDSNEESYKAMGLAGSPKVYCSQDEEDEVAVVLTWNSMSSAQKYLTQANFVQAEDEGKHEESLRHYISNTHLFSVNDEGIKALARGGNVVYSGGDKYRILSPNVQDKDERKYMRPGTMDEDENKFMRPGAMDKDEVKAMRPAALDKDDVKAMRPGVYDKDDIKAMRPAALDKDDVKAMRPAALDKDDVKAMRPAALDKDDVKAMRPAH